MLSREAQHDILVKTREYLSDPDHWIKGRSRSADHKRYCVTGYMTHVLKLGGGAGWRDNDALEFLFYLSESVRPPFSTVTAFNDSRYVEHEEMLAWLDERIAELAPVELEYA